MSRSKTEPSVCCVMLTANRPAMARRAVECFRAQTYANARLAILNTGAGCDEGNRKIKSFHYLAGAGKTIGELRNIIPNSFVGETNAPEIFIHWDDDDFSHPNRIAEQVALLQSSGAELVGYNEMLFWREPVHSVEFPARQPGGCDLGVRNVPGEAWLYRNPDPHYALGTSLCYTRSFWEHRPFEATSQGEDLRFIAGRKCASVSSIGTDGTPRLVARIHSGNTSTAYRPEAMQRETQKRDGMWKRVPEYDEYCAGVFA